MGLIQSLWSDCFPPAPHFTAKDIPDLAGKVIIVTGANAGIGKETARVLLKKNAKVYLEGRNSSKSDAAIKDLEESTKKRGIPLVLDLADLKSVKAAAEEFLSKEAELHVLINNAGVMGPPINYTAQGYDIQFGTNVLGHFYFTKLLTPLLSSTTRREANLRDAGTSAGINHVAKSRVVHLSSIMARLVYWKLDFQTFKEGKKQREKGKWYLYSQSKLCNSILANQFAKRYGDTIVSTSVNPGNISTTILQHNSWWKRPFLDMVTCHPVEMGALTQLWAATSLEGQEFNGKTLGPWCRQRPANKRALDGALGDQLWDWLEEQVKDL